MHIVNRIKTENQIPIQWQLTTVKSIHKGGVKENIQENQRGMFLVNMDLKTYESALKIQNEKKCKMQCKQQITNANSWKKTKINGRLPNHPELNNRKLKAK